MGGYHRSSLELEKQRVARLQLIEDVSTLASQLEGLQAELERTLKSATSGIVATFTQEIATMKAWQKEAADDSKTVDATAADSELQSRREQLARLVEVGEQGLRELLVCLSDKGDQMAHELAHRLVAIRMLLSKHAIECGRWFSREVEAWKEQFEQASRLHDEEHFVEATQVLEAVEADISERVEQAETLAMQHQSRMYLLKSVRQVCCDLGMREVERPRLEHPGDVSSRMLLTVASPDRGRLRFALSLDGIQNVGEAHQCSQDLAAFSKHLSDQFGIRTKFRPVADDDLPTRKTAQHRHLPDSQESSAAFQG